MNELKHHGIKGQKKGINRYQSTSGVWTPLGLKRRREREGDGEKRFSLSYKNLKTKHQKKAVEKAQRKYEEAMKYASEKQKVRELKRKTKMLKKGESEETIPDSVKKEKLLKTTNVNELIKNKDLLSTSELRERIERIRLEQQLDSLKPETISKGQKALNFITNISNAYDKIPNSIKKPIIDTVKKELGVEKKTKFDYDKVLKNVNDLSYDEIKKAASRAKEEKELINNIKSINKFKKEVEDASAKAAKEAAEKAAKAKEEKDKRKEEKKRKKEEKKRWKDVEVVDEKQFKSKKDEQPEIIDVDWEEVFDIINKKNRKLLK